MRLLFLALLLAISSIAHAQQHVSVDNNLTGVQIGLVGVHVYHETKLRDDIVLRTALSVNVGVNNLVTTNDSMSVDTYPALIVEPRFYYSHRSRYFRDLNHKHNSSNYLSCQLKYNSSVLSTNKTIDDSIALIPTFGIRRNFMGYLNYEMNLGVGYRVGFSQSSSATGLAVDVGLRVGLDF